MLHELLSEAVATGKLLPASKTNIEKLLASAPSPFYENTVRELAEAAEWDDLNDRFFRSLTFGTGGLRGRTMARIITRTERGSAPDRPCPEFPCVGTNAMNYYNISRASQGLASYVWDYFRQQKRQGRPKICICHDTRYFSREFAEFTANIFVGLGCDALLFNSFRSTPELSFAIRMLGAQAGVNITASHNPPAYNGYKVYFEDGGQIVEPHASNIIERVQAITSETISPLPLAEQGKIIPMGEEVDAAYLDRLQTLILELAVLQAAKSLRFVFSPLHGTGATIVEPLLQRLGISYSLVASQTVPDGGFSTVASPNPEVKEALNLAIEQAIRENADVVLATDPDADRLGVAVRSRTGEMELLTGNQIGALLAWHRTSRMFALGILTPANRSHAAIIKTFVTSDLQKAIAAHYGIRCVETLTGFKYIGAKLQKYELALPTDLREHYFALSEAETRHLRLTNSTFFVFGGEESYGYSGADFVRDKDANSAVAMLAEAAAFAHTQGKTVLDLLDDIYIQYGYYLERGESLTMEGADGSARIAALVASYASAPPSEIDGKKVLSFRNFATEDLQDCEGDAIPKEALMMFELEGGFRMAVRPSGTEPKIKYYLFGAELPKAGQEIPRESLDAIKIRVADALESLWQWVQKDSRSR